MIYLGTSGWYYDHWIDKFYPKELEKSDWLSFYSKRFDTVEVNASFYRMPFKNMVKGWYRKTPDDFKFTFKGSRIVTHRKKLQDVDEYLRRFYERIKLIEDKLLVILWQLPPFLKRDNDLLESFLNSLDSHIPQVIEFRDKSWDKKSVYKLLEKYKVGYCIVSCPDFPSKVRVTSDFAYIRWHGKKNWYKYNYSQEELSKWAERIKDLDVDNVYGYFNNDFKGYAPKNCEQLRELLSKS